MNCVHITHTQIVQILHVHLLVVVVLVPVGIGQDHCIVVLCTHATAVTTSRGPAIYRAFGMVLY